MDVEDGRLFIDGEHVMTINVFKYRFVIRIGREFCLKYYHNTIMTIFGINFDFPYYPMFDHLVDMIENNVIDEELCKCLARLIKLLKLNAEVATFRTYEYRETTKYWHEKAKSWIGYTWHGFTENINDDIPNCIYFNDQAFYIDLKFATMITTDQITGIEEIASILQQVSEIMLTFPPIIKSAA